MASKLTRSDRSPWRWTEPRSTVGRPHLTEPPASAPAGLRAASRSTTSPRRTASRETALGIAALLLLATGCNLLTPLAFVVPYKKTVAPEFDKLPGHRVVVLVWTDPSTLFDYPHARFELSAYVGDKLQTELGKRQLNIDVVDPRDIEDHLGKNAGADVDPLGVGRAFQADYVVYLEVLRFQFRDPQRPQFLRGRIDAAVSVHDVHADPDELQRYELTQLRCAHPEAAPVPLTATNAVPLRQATYYKFAELVARKFYEYTLDF